jgi:hypothetical protein
MPIVQISLQFGTRPSSWRSRDIPVAPSSSHSVPRVSTVTRGIQCWALQSGEKSPHSCRPSREIKRIKRDIKWSPEVKGPSYPEYPVLVRHRHKLCQCTLLLPTENLYSVVVLSDYHTDWNTDKSWFKSCWGNTFSFYPEHLEKQWGSHSLPLEEHGRLLLLELKRLRL